MIYLAVPYSHPSPAVRHARFEAVNKYAAHLMQQRKAVFSPISHSHPIEEHFTETQSGEFWKIQDLPILEICDELHVLCLDGYVESTGVSGKILAAFHKNIPIKFINPVTFLEEEPCQN